MGPPGPPGPQGNPGEQVSVHDCYSNKFTRMLSFYDDVIMM